MNGYILGVAMALAGFILVFAGYQICETDHIALDELKRSGYAVVRHSETHGTFSTNWVEVVRTNGRAL